MLSGSSFTHVPQLNSIERQAVRSEHRFDLGARVAERPGRRLRIAVLAPPWFPVPPVGYGGIEEVIDLLCTGLVARGHEVALFAAPGSRSSAHVYPLLHDAHPEAIGSAMYEAAQFASAWGLIDRAASQGRPFDVIHDHSGFTALALADHLAAPMIHTLHGAFTPSTARFYRRYGHKAQLVAISRAQAESAPDGVRISAVIPNPIGVDRWPLVTEKDDYLLWVGRMDAVKGAHRAIRVARLSGRRLVLAGPVQPGQERYFAERVKPELDDQRLRYVGEVGGLVKQELFAHAGALLMPIRWREPFGMVMVEALACGTPVIAFREGAATEIVINGVNGMLVGDELEMARAVTSLESIDPRRCRESVARRYDVPMVAAAYEQMYWALTDSDEPRGSACSDDCPSAERVSAAPGLDPARAGSPRARHLS